MKYRLKTSRVEVTDKGIYPICAVCGGPIFNIHGVDMHEVVTRGMARNVDEDIFVKENCVLVHTGKCHRIAQHEKIGRLLCTDYLIHIEGLENIFKFRQRVIDKSLGLGEITMANLKKLVDALDDKGIKATGTIENAIALGREHGVLNGWTQNGRSWGLRFAGKRKEEVTDQPVEAILEQVLDSLKTKSTKSESESDGGGDPAPEDS